MAYRKLIVDGTPFEYTVGTTHVKIRGMGAVPKHQVGVVIDDYTVNVQPSHIVDFIRENRK